MKRIIPFIISFFISSFLWSGYVYADQRPLSSQETISALQDKTFLAHSIKEEYDYRIYYAKNGTFTLYYSTYPGTAVTVSGTWSVDDKGKYCTFRKIHKHKFVECGRIYQDGGSTLYQYNTEGKLEVTFDFVGNGNHLEDGQE